MKYRYGLAGCLIVLFSGIAFPANASEVGRSARAGSSVQITMLSGWPLNQSRGAVLKQLVDSYNKSHSGKIKVSVNINPDWPALQQQIRTSISAGRAPDIFQYNFNPNDLSIQKSGKLMDFSPYMNGAWRRRFQKADLSMLSIHGKLLSIPFEADGVPFYYNRSLFAKAGISSFPKTWDQFFKDCTAFKKVGAEAVSLMTQNDAWHATNVFTYAAAGVGGPKVFVGKSLDTSAIVQAATVLKKAFGCSTADALGANYDVSSNNFLTGRTAMVADGPWAIGPIETGFKGASDVGVAPAPTFPHGKGKAGLLVTDAQSPFAAGRPATKQKALAIVDFLKYLTSASSAKKFMLQGRLTVSLKVHLSAQDKKAADPILAKFLQVYNKAPQRVVQVTRVLKPAALAQLPSLIESLALGNTTPKEFAQKLQASNK